MWIMRRSLRLVQIISCLLSLGKSSSPLTQLIDKRLRELYMISSNLVFVITIIPVFIMLTWSHIWRGASVRREPARPDQSWSHQWATEITFTWRSCVNDDDKDNDNCDNCDDDAATTVVMTVCLEKGEVNTGAAGEAGAAGDSTSWGRAWAAHGHREVTGVFSNHQTPVWKSIT